MYLRIEVIVYFYMFLCICMVIFNISYIKHNKTDEKRCKKKAMLWKNIIQKQVELKRQGLLQEKNHAKYIKRKLLRLNELYVFNNVLEELQDRIPRDIEGYILDNSEVFIQLADEYRHKESMKKAYYAYSVSQYLIRENHFKNRMSEIILDYVIDSSIYCRENSLRALYSLGNTKSVVLAYQIMNRNNIKHNSKLVTDGLLLFQGNKQELAKELWKNIKEFDIAYQLSFISFIRMVSGDFCEEFLKVLKDRETDREIQFAIIRYYRKYYYEPAKEYLLNYLNFQEGFEWEYSALAASTLENYPSAETIRVLKLALSSNNWYTRYNAADSLKHLGVKYIDLLDIYNGNDRYAMEMIQYKMSEEGHSA